MDFNPENLANYIRTPRPERPQTRPSGPSAGGSPPDRSQVDAAQELASIKDPGARHDAALRNHLSELVRTMVSSNQHEKLHGLLCEHRDFIQGIINVLEGKEK